MAGFIEKLKEESLKCTAEKRLTYTGISSESLSRLSEETGISLREMEKKALENNIIPLRYQRNLGTFGIKGQIALLNATAAVIGAGGLGGLVLELLARAGTGHIVIVDPDSFDEANMNRQVFSTMATLYKQKARIAEQRIREINPALSTTCHVTPLSAGNAGYLLSGSDVVVDCVDHIPTRLLIQDAAHELLIPMVSAAIAGFAGYVTTILPGDIGWKALVDTKQIPERGAELLTGNPPTSPAFAASLEAQEVIKLLTGKGEILKDKLFFFDLETNTFETVVIPDQ